MQYNYIVKVPEVNILSVPVKSDKPLKVSEIKEIVANKMAAGELKDAESTYDSTLNQSAWAVEAMA